MDFLHKVGYKISGNVPTINMPQLQQSPKTPKHIDDANLMALKLALGDNSNYYTHFVATSSMYGNQIMMQQQQQQPQQQFQPQTYPRYQQSPHHQIQRLQRMYQRGQPEGCYPQMYHHSMYQEQDLSPVPQPGQQVQGTFSQSYSNSSSYQNRNKGNRRDYQRDNSKKNRNGYNNFQNAERNNRNRNYNNRNGLEVKSQSLNEENSTKSNNLTHNRNGSEDQVYRSLSPTPPSSSKSSSPGVQEKCIDKDITITNGCNYETAEDSDPSSTASFVSEMSLSAPVLLKPEESTTNISLWIDNNFGKALHNGLSVSAEHLNMTKRDSPVTIIKRPLSKNSNQKKHSNHPSRNSKKPSYNPQYPFDYYLSRSDESEVRTVPSSLRCGTKWDLMSEEIWQKFQVHQQSRQSYRNKMHLWRDLYNAAKVN